MALLGAAAALWGWGAATAAASGCGGEGDADDWLTAGCPVRSALTQAQLPDGSTSFVLANGVVSRTMVANASTGLLATTGIATLGGRRVEKLRLSGGLPESLFSANGVDVVVGGAGPTTASDTRPRARFAGVRTGGAVRAGGFHHVPGARGSNPNTAWPPKGAHVEFDHALPCGDVGAGTGGTVVATVVMELYDETASFGRRVKLAHNCSEPLYIFNLSVSVLGGARDRDITTQTDAAVSTGRQLQDPFDPTVRYVSTGELPRYRCHLGCIFLKMPAISLFYRPPPLRPVPNPANPKLRAGAERLEGERPAIRELLRGGDRARRAVRASDLSRLVA